MALKITEVCANCDQCAPVCPNEAIAPGECIYVIDPQKCTECIDVYDSPQCVEACPVDSIEPDPEHPCLTVGGECAGEQGNAGDKPPR